jgi:ABC-2 type transport system ATP-binding protein
VKVSVNDFAIELRGITKEYPGTHALQGIDLQVRTGRIHGFLGPNGAGKSTAMNIISGLIPPTEGDVFVLGQDVIKDPDHAKLSIGLLPEHPPLYLNMKVEDYLKFSQEIHGAIDHAHLHHVVKSLSLGSMSQRLIGNLSKGYRQRVAMAQALVYKAPIIILDEPMVGLDPNAIAQMRELICELKKEHTILLSTHQLYEAAKICDDITIIHNGLIKETGVLADLEHHILGMTSFMAKVSNVSDKLIQVLTDLDGVKSFELKNNKTEVLVKVNHSSDLRPSLTKIFVEHSELLEFKELHLDLEEIFKQVVSND